MTISTERIRELKEAATGGELLIHDEVVHHGRSECRLLTVVRNGYHYGHLFPTVDSKLLVKARQIADKALELDAENQRLKNHVRTDNSTVIANLVDENKRLREALENIMDVSGTSCLHFHIAEESLAGKGD